MARPQHFPALQNLVAVGGIADIEHVAQVKPRPPDRAPVQYINSVELAAVLLDACSDASETVRMVPMSLAVSSAAATVG